MTDPEWPNAPRNARRPGGSMRRAKRSCRCPRRQRARVTPLAPRCCVRRVGGRPRGSEATPDSTIWRWGRRVLRVLRDAAIAAAIVAAVRLAHDGCQPDAAAWLYQPSFQESQRRVREAELSRRGERKDPSVTRSTRGSACRLAARETAVPMPRFHCARRQSSSLDRGRTWPYRRAARIASVERCKPSRVFDVITAVPSVCLLRRSRTCGSSPPPRLAGVRPRGERSTVDVIGGRFQLPFSPDARSYAMPIRGGSRPPRNGVRQCVTRRVLPGHRQARRSRRRAAADDQLRLVFIDNAQASLMRSSAA